MALARNGGLAKVYIIIKLTKQKETTKDPCDIWRWWRYGKHCPPPLLPSESPTKLSPLIHLTCQV